MSRLVARILLAILMLPAAATVFLVAFLMLDSSRYYFAGTHQITWALSGLLAWIFVVVYWLALWHGGTLWSSRRRLLTFITAFASLFLGIASTVSFYFMIDRWRSVWVGTLVAPITWLIATTLIWRETPGERSQRLGSINHGGIACPSCGYNLTGLQGTRCPECGTLYTLDELLASHPSRSDEEVTG